MSRNNKDSDSPYATWVTYNGDEYVEGDYNSSTEVGGVVRYEAGWKCLAYKCYIDVQNTSVVMCGNLR